MTKAPGEMGAFEPSLERTEGIATADSGAPAAYVYAPWGCGREQLAGVCAAPMGWSLPKQGLG
jgi:hypothetical protein